MVGHSFGGLLAQIVAGRGLAAVAVASLDPAPFRGVLPLPLSALKASSPVLRNPAYRHGRCPTYEQFRYGFANAVDEDEAKPLYEAYAVPGSGAPLFQAAQPTSTRGASKVDSRTPTAGHCSSSPARRTTPSPGRSPTPPSSASSATRG